MVGAFMSGGQQFDGAQAARIPPGLRIYAIGDIHGCAALLNRMHASIGVELAASPATAAIVVYLGDYVDRGPDSKGVLDMLSQPGPPGIQRIFLKGNHEDMVLGVLQDPDQVKSWSRLGGFETLLSYGLDPRGVLKRGGFPALVENFAAEMPPAHVRFLSDLETSFSAGDYFFCHAGVRPGVPLALQDPHDLMWIRHDFLRSEADHGKIIVHGHTAVEEPDVRPNRINVDTGAYATGCLTALVLEGASRRFLRV